MKVILTVAREVEVEIPDKFNVLAEIDYWSKPNRLEGLNDMFVACIENAEEASGFPWWGDLDNPHNTTDAILYISRAKDYATMCEC